MALSEVIKSGKLAQKVGSTLTIMHYETEASVVLTSNGSNVQAELDALTAAISGKTGAIVVADIAARDAIQTPLTGQIAYVLDATADATVASGGAGYIYNESAWVKIFEFESMDVVTDWANIQNKPTSTVTAIDAAVEASHTHDNKAVLDELTEGDNGLLYKGASVGAITVVSEVTEEMPDGMYFVTSSAAGA